MQIQDYRINKDDLKWFLLCKFFFSTIFQIYFYVFYSILLNQFASTHFASITYLCVLLCSFCFLFLFLPLLMCFIRWFNEIVSRSHLREIRDRSVLRLFESNEVSAPQVPAGPGVPQPLPQTGGHWDQDQVIFFEEHVHFIESHFFLVLLIFRHFFLPIAELL